jgi:hypothetical protein
MSLRNHVYYYKEILIGLTVESLLYSFKTGYPIIYKISHEPDFYEIIEKDFDLSDIEIPTNKVSISTLNGQVVEYYQKRDLYDRLLPIISISGLVPHKMPVSEIHLEEEEKRIKIVSGTQRIFRYEFDTLRVFDTRNLNFLTPSGNKKEKMLIIDIFSSSIENGIYSHLEFEGDFPKKCFIKDPKTKVITHSYLTMDELNNSEYSSFFITKKTESLLSGHAIKAKLTWEKRDLSFKDSNEYLSTDIITIDERSEKEIWQETDTLFKWQESYQFKLAQKTKDTRGLVL